MERIPEDKRQKKAWVEGGSKAVALAEIENNELEERWATGVEEFDRVTGGGIVRGSFGLLGGAPGVGKSTLILQLLSRLAGIGKKTLYISGEESENQIKARAERLLLRQEKMLVLIESSLEAILSQMAEIKPDFVVIDSIQTLYDPSLEAGPGSVTQVRETAQALMRFGKQRGVSLFLVGHVTKGGDLAGPRTLEHMVDYVLYLEGESKERLRILRGVKNRFGEVHEVGLFKMTAKGLAEASDAGNMMVGRFDWSHAGTSVFAASEGKRIFFLEVQVLAGDTQQSYPARTANGMDKNRLLTLVAVLEKNLNMDFSRNDIYVNLAGGFRVTETGMDMAVMAALLSSHLRKALPENSLFLGEVALNGQFRPLPNLEDRVQEALRCGFTRVYVPQLINGSIKNTEQVADISKLMQIVG